ncbi:Eukaryotic aspartyl protease family protein [Rhynchospora pubera]|uniref:nepenthesin n=1 Tax=Rhynchospora pubera TaxID=906938 RepID=A0AAV8DB52_9POAL|nr:Eukaryotic aspartyl protease family protein [Rhynchospora pubera]
MKTKNLHNILTLTTIFILLISSCHAKSSKHSVKHLRIDLRHIDSTGNFSKYELLQRMTHRSHQRMIHLTRRISNLAHIESGQELGAQTDAYLGTGEFVMDVGVGTPSLSFPGIIDTGSDLVWTQCKPCVRCFNQSTELFDPSKSSTYKQLPCKSDLCKALPASQCGKTNNSCQYAYGYADLSFTQGNLSSETMTLGSQEFKNIAFGCANNNSDGFPQSSGLVGLGRGPLSLTSQLGFKKFSHCFASLDLKKKSPMLFGSLVSINASAATASTQSTPLVQNKEFPSFYYLSLLGITVGTTKLNIPSSTFALKSDGGSGTIIDSGTTLTYLQPKAYNIVRKAFVSQTKLHVADGSTTGFDLCFKATSNTTFGVPKLILHFQGADLDLPESNYFIHDKDSGLLCSTIMPSFDSAIIGNMLQQNIFVIYDIAKNILSFAPTQCEKL